MALSLIFDDTSLLLTLVIILLLSFTIYLGKGYQPLVHPLILSRQSDVSPIRHKGQSAIYRNSNSPVGLDLPSKPRRKVNGVLDILQSGSEGPDWSLTKKRTFYGEQKSNSDVIETCRKFASGLASICGLSSTSELGVAVCVEADSTRSIQVISSGGVQAKANQAFTPLVVSPDHVKKGNTPSNLPASISSNRLHAIYTSSIAQSSALQLPGVDKDTSVIVATEKEAQSIRTQIPNRVILFDDVLGHSSVVSLTDPEKTENVEQLGEAVQSVYWTGRGGWVKVTNSTLTAAITAHLAFFQADSQPKPEDHILVALTHSNSEDKTIETSSQALAACCHPAGLVLPLLALYSGASITATSTIESAPSVNLSETQPSLLYASPSSASTLASEFCSLTRRRAFAHPAVHSKLAFLRHGTFLSTSFWDTFVFEKVRTMLGCQDLRSMIIVSEGSSVPQGLLDILRSHLSCPVRQAYLPSSPSRTFDSELTAGIGADTSQLNLSSSALFTAPITATHSLDLQAFSNDKGLASTHLGPPNVAVEVKLVESMLAKGLGYTMEQSGGKDDSGRASDPYGEIFVRGHTIAGTSNAKQWCATGDIGSFRSNGTLVIVRDQNETKQVAVPSLTSTKGGRKGSTGGGKVVHGSSFATILMLLLFFICSCQVEAGVVEGRGEAPHLSKRSDSSINSTLVETAVMGFLSSPRASWEQGVTQSSLLECYSGSWSIFTSEGSRGPPYLPQALRADAQGPSNQLLSMAFSSVNSQDSFGKLCTQVTGDETPRDGSALDAASCGEAVLLAAFKAGDIQNGAVANPNGFWMQALQRQLTYLLNRAPKTPQGAISMRSTGLAYWSDGLYMAPPFLALYGLMTRNQSLLQESYNQANHYIQALRINSGPAQGLLRHIVNGTVVGGASTDNGAWLTGNAWAASGMVKVIATISQSEYASEMQSQVNDLISWTQAILDGCYRNADPLIRNYINDTTTFYDAAGSSLIAYATYRLASLSPANNSQHIDAANAIYFAVQDKLSPFGVFNSDVDVVDSLTFTSTSQMSPESLAFMVLMASARRDHIQGNITGLNGPSSGFTGGSSTTMPLHSSTIAVLFGSLASTLLALLLL